MSYRPSTMSTETVKRSEAHTNRSLIDGTMRIFLSEGLFLPAGLLITVVLTRKLGPHDYGIFTLATVIIVWTERLIASTFNGASIALLSQEDEWRSVATALVRTCFFVSATVSIFLWWFATDIASILGEPKLGTLLAVFVLDIPIYVLARACRNIMTGIGQFKTRGRVSAVYWIGRLIFIVLLVQIGFGIQGAIIGTILASLAELVLSMAYLRISVLKKSAYSGTRLWKQSGSLLLFGLVQNSRSISALTVLKILGGTAEQVGYYGGMQNLIRLPALAFATLSSTFLATIRRIISTGSDLHRAKHLSEQALRFVVLLLPYSGLILGTLSEIIWVVFGIEYLPAAPIGVWLAFGVVPLGLVSINMAILIAAGKSGWPLMVAGPLLPAAIVAHLYMVPINGPLGTAQVVTMSFVVGAIVTGILVFRLWSVVPPMKTCIRSILVCGIAYYTALSWPVEGISVFLKLSGLGGLVLLLFGLMGEFSRKEISLVWSLLPFRAVHDKGSGA